MFAAGAQTVEMGCGLREIEQLATLLIPRAKS